MLVEARPRPSRALARDLLRWLGRAAAIAAFVAFLASLDNLGFAVAIDWSGTVNVDGAFAWKPVVAFALLFAAAALAGKIGRDDIRDAVGDLPGPRWFDVAAFGRDSGGDGDEEGDAGGDGD